MHRILLLASMLMLTPCLTGCFSQLSRIGGAGAGTGGSSTSGRVMAGALDVVTAPVQAPFIAYGAASSAAERSSRDSVEAIRKQPQHIFTYRRDLSVTTILKAIQDPTIPFTDNQFHKLAGKTEWTRNFVVANPRCPQAILEEVWNGRTTIPPTELPSLGYSFATNPNVPEAWLAAIAQTPELYKDSSSLARSALESRKVTKPNDSAPPSPIRR